MIIDSHAHLIMPQESYRYFSELVGGRGNPSTSPKIPDESIRTCGENLLKIMDSVGTDIQLLSPRPYLQLHSITPAIVPELWNRHTNDLIYRIVQMFPDRFRGVAGLPQHLHECPSVRVIAELERCVKELGFVGCLLNPDPTEGTQLPPPGLGDPFWYPLYEKLVELDVPALIHSAGNCQSRESYTLKFINEESTAIISLLQSRVFERFPSLKIVVPHGGGAIPYQMGRFRAWSVRKGETQSFDEKLRKLYFDTCNYSQDALDFLFRVVGTENVLFGTEKPGTGSARDPQTGRDFDHLKPLIEGIEWLSAADRKRIFEDNCSRLYNLHLK